MGLLTVPDHAYLAFHFFCEKMHLIHCDRLEIPNLYNEPKWNDLSFNRLIHP